VYLRREQPDEIPQAGTPSGRHDCATQPHAIVPRSSSASLPTEDFTLGSTPHARPHVLAAAAAAAAGLLTRDGDAARHMSGVRFVPCSGTAVHGSSSPSDNSNRIFGAQPAVASPQPRPQHTMSRVQSMPAMQPGAVAQSADGMPTLPGVPQHFRLGLHALLGQQSPYGLSSSAGDRAEEYSNAPSFSGASSPNDSLYEALTAALDPSHSPV